MTRNVLTKTELLGEDGIPFGPFDHVQEAEIRKARAIIAYDRAHDLLVAARHERVGDRLIDRFPLRDRQHMRLAFGAHIGDERVLLEPPGFTEHGAGNFDRIVEG